VAGDAAKRLFDPAVVSFVRIEVGDQRPGIDERHLRHWPKPFMGFGLVARSRTPL